MSDEQPRPRQRPGRRRHLGRKLLIGFLVLVAFVGTGLFLVYRHLDNNIHGLDVTSHLGKSRPTAITVAGPKQPMNVLVMGNDTRQGANGNGIGGATPGLSDTTILLHLSASRKFAYGVSIPRDSEVKRPQCDTRSGGSDPGGLTQFNDAFAIGGPACTIKTVEHLTGIHIDHFVVVDFVGFKTMVDAVGGVTVCVPTEVNDTHGHIHLPAGTYNASGQQALDYVRVRNDLGAPTGDIGRMKRQQAFIASMINKVVSAGTLTNPVRMYRFLDAATKSLTTDQSFAHLSALASLGSSLKGIGLGNVKFITVPWRPYPPDINRVEWTPQAKLLWHLVKYDRPLTTQFSTDVLTAAGGAPGVKATSKGPSAHASKSAQARARQRAQAAAASAAANGLCG
ncbi:MAG: LCP family protein [Actinomycetota bacterium]|nr:LCP family protein [Actinomycetota bacterium]